MEDQNNTKQLWTQRIVGVVLWILIFGFAYALIAIRSPWTAGMWLRASQDLHYRLQDYVVTMSWYAAAANLLLCLVLFFTRRWWLRPPKTTARTTPPKSGFGRPWMWALIFAATIAAAVMGWPRMNHSLWGDEAYSFRRAIHGFYQQNPEGQLEFRRVSWMETLWSYRNPNNHIPYSIVARLAMDRAAQEGWDWDRFQRVVRWPAFIAGLAAILATGLLLIRLGYGRSAVLASWLLVLHPWMLRYLVEARGYAFVLLLTPLTLLLAVEACRRPTWPRWAGFGFSQFLLLYAYPGMVYFLVVLNLGVLALLWPRKERPDLAPLLRWGVSCLASAMLFWQLFAPCVPQLLEYLDRDRAQAAMTTAWIADASTLLASGMTWHSWDPGNPLALGLATLTGQSAVWTWIFLVLLPLFLVAGILRLLGHGWESRLAAAALVLPVVLSVAVAGWREMLMYLWYVVYAVPSVAVLVALGIDFPSDILRKGKAGLAVTATLGVLFLVGYGIGTDRQRQVLRSHSTEPQRESVELTRNWLDPTQPTTDNVITVGFLMSSVTYDPWKMEIEEADELIELMEQARAEGKPLFVNFGQRGLARERHPDLMEWLEDPSIFEEVEVLYGLEPFNTRHVYRLRDHALTEPEIDAVPSN